MSRREIVAEAMSNLRKKHVSHKKGLSLHKNENPHAVTAVASLAPL